MINYLVEFYVIQYFPKCVKPTQNGFAMVNKYQKVISQNIIKPTPNPITALVIL